MDKIGNNKKHMVKVEWSFSLLLLVIISKVILFRPHSVVAHSRYKSSGIKTGQISLAGRQREKSRFSPGRFTTEARSAAAAHEDCSRLPLKPTSIFQLQMTQEHCQSLSLKALSGLLRKSIQTPLETARLSRHNYKPLNLTALFRSNSESLT